MNQSELKEFYEIGRLLSSEKDTAKLLDMIVRSCMNFTSSDGGSIYIVTEKDTGNFISIKDGNYENKLAKFVTAKNMSIDADFASFAFPITKQSIFGYVLITGNTVRIDDAYCIGPEIEYRHNNSFDIKVGYRTKSILCVPMKDHEGHVLGVIQLINKKKAKCAKIRYDNPASIDCIVPYNVDDEVIMNSFAGQAAVVLENNLLYRDLNKLLEDYKLANEHLVFLTQKFLKATEEERKRIGREIHDGAAQSVANLSFKVEVCKKYMQNNDFKKLGDSLEVLKDNIRETTKEIRAIIYDLKPSFIEDGLFAAVERYAETFECSSCIKVSCVTMGDDSGLEYYLVSTIYRIIQEALSNINKHAEAKNVDINIHVTSKNIAFSVVDDGKGFEADGGKEKKTPSLEGGFGIQGIRERVEIVRGSISIESKVGEGTRIEINIPVVRS